MMLIIYVVSDLNYFTATLKYQKMKKIIWIAFGLLLFAGGCGTSKITTSWKAENIVPRNYTKIMVLGLIQQKDRSLRERMEQHFAGDLTDLGYTALSSLQEYGPKAFEGLDEKAAIEKIKNSGVDAIVTIVLLDKKKEQKYVPGHYVYKDNNFWDYVGIRNNRIYEPGYYVTDTRYFWESNFYDMSNQALLYSVQTKSFSPASTESMGHEYGQMIVKNMVKNKVLHQQKTKEEE